MDSQTNGSQNLEQYFLAVLKGCPQLFPVLQKFEQHFPWYHFPFAIQLTPPDLTHKGNDKTKMTWPPTTPPTPPNQVRKCGSCYFPPVFFRFRSVLLCTGNCHSATNWSSAADYFCKDVLKGLKFTRTLYFLWMKSLLFHFHAIYLAAGGRCHPLCRKKYGWCKQKGQSSERLGQDVGGSRHTTAWWDGLLLFFARYTAYMTFFALGRLEKRNKCSVHFKTKINPQKVSADKTASALQALQKKAPVQASHLSFQKASHVAQW